MQYTLLPPQICSLSSSQQEKSLPISAFLPYTHMSIPTYSNFQVNMVNFFTKKHLFVRFACVFPILRVEF